MIVLKRIQTKVKNVFKTEIKSGFYCCETKNGSGQRIIKHLDFD